MKASPKKSKNDAGLIIWTFRRTGGTNLTSAILKSLDGKTTEHEPFNTDRIFGHITAKWKETRDVDQLTSSLHEVFSQKISIKHCLEIIPMEMNSIILEVAVKYDYEHLFLYRENATDRLLSLNYALKTGIWGRKQKELIQDNEDVFSEPINIPKLLKHEISCRRGMRNIYDNLRSKGGSPIAVSFESLYKSSQQYSRALVKELFEQITGDTPAHIKPLYQNLVRHGSQGSSSNYMHFPGADELVSEADKLTPFQLRQKVDFTLTMADDEHQVIHSEFWDVLSGTQEDKFYLHGVILCDTEEHPKIKVEQSERSVFVKTGLASRRIEKMYPDVGSASHCRFFLGPINSREEVLIYIQSSPNKSPSLARLKLSRNPAIQSKTNI